MMNGTIFVICSILAISALLAKNGETRGKTNEIKSKLACILEASESTRMRMEESLPNNHEDHIAGKVCNSLQHYNLVHTFIPMPQAMKIPTAKAAVDKEWEKLEKVPAWDLTKVRSKKEVIDEARTKGAKVHFVSLMDICHLKNAELETKHQKYKGRVVLRGDIVKNDSGSYAVFTEQGSTASQMTAAKVMDIISRQPGCSGQAADAVSACTQVKMKDAPKLLKIPKSECPDIWIRLQRHKWPKSWSSMEDPVVPLERLMMYNHTSWLKTSHVSSVFMSASCHPHTIHGERLIVCCFSVPRFVLFLVSLLHLAFLFPLLPVFCPEPLLPCEQRRGKTYPASPPNEESCSLTEFTLPTSYKPKLHDDFHYSETIEMIFQEESGDKDTEPSYLCDAELDDETIGRALSSPLFIQERGESADRRQAYHSLEESLLPTQSLFAHSRTVRPLHELSSLSSCTEKQSREMENETIRILQERQKEQIFAEVRSEIQKHEFQADSDRRSIQELNGIIESQRREIDHALAGDEQLRRDQLLHEQLPEQNRDRREAHLKSLSEMEELKRFQGSTFDEFSRRRLIEDQDTILEVTARIQELQNEVNCMNDSRDFKDAESVRSGLSHVTSQPALHPPFRDPGGMLSCSVEMLSRNDRPPSIWDTHGISRNVFVNPLASSSTPYPPGQGFNPWISNVSEHTSPHVTSERQTPDTTLDSRCQSGPSARNSFDPSEGRSSNNNGADQQRLQISDLHFDKFPTPCNIRLLEDKIQD